MQIRDRERTEYVLDGAGKKRFDFSFTGYHGENHSFVLLAEDEAGGRLIGPAATPFGLSFDIWQACSDQQNFIGSPWLFFKNQYNWIRVPPAIHVWSSYQSLGRPVGAPADGFFGDDNHWIGADLAIGRMPDPPIRYVAARFHGGVASRDLVRNDITCDLYKTGETGYSVQFTPRTDSTGEMQLYLFKPQYSEGNGTITYDSVLASYHLQNSKASLVLVDGAVTAKQDIPLKDNFLDVCYLVCGSGAAPAWQRQDGYTVRYLDPAGHTVTWQAPAKGGHLEGLVRKGGYVFILPMHTGSLGFYPLDRDMAFTFQHDGRYGWTFRLGMKAPARLVKAGERFSARVVIARTDQGYAPAQAQACLENVRREFGMGLDAPAFTFALTSGKWRDRQFLQQAEAQEGAICGVFAAPPLSWPCVPLAVSGLNDNWDAAVYGDAGTPLRRIPVRDGIGYASLDPARASCRTVWVGHPVVCDQPQAHLLVLENGRDVCEVQVHNPTEKPMSIRLRPATSAVKLGLLPDFSRTVQVPAFGIARVRVQRGAYTPPPYRDTLYAIDHVMAQGWVVQDVDATWLQAVRAADKPGLMVAAAGQLRKDWENYGPIGVDEPAGPLEMVVRMKLLGQPGEDTPVARLVVVGGDGPAGLSDYGGRALANEHEVASREVRTAEFTQPDTYQDVVLKFDRPKDGWMGYHVEWLGGAYVQVDTITIRQPIPLPSPPAGGILGSDVNY